MVAGKPLLLNNGFLSLSFDTKLITANLSILYIKIKITIARANQTSTKVFLRRGIYSSKFFTFFESLILAQDERWRCALSMQVERDSNIQWQTGE